MTTPDFSKIWGTNGNVTYQFSDNNYLEGWQFIGNVPPARGMFDAYFNGTDKKLKYLFDTSTSDLSDNNAFHAESTGYGIVSGCTLSVSGLTATVSAGVVHTSTGKRVEISQQTVNLNSADASNPRIDVIYIDTDGNVGYLPGSTTSTAAPDLEAGWIKLGEITIVAGATTRTITADYNHYKNPSIVFDNVKTMRQDRTLIPQMVARTLGYYTINDGGGAMYIIRSKADSDTDDGGSVIVLDNGNVAELVIEGAVNVKQFGAKGDGTTDDTMSINNALALGKNTVFPKATYLVSSPLILQSYTCVDLCSSTIVGNNADADVFLFSRELNPTESLTLQNGIIRGTYLNAIHLKGKNKWEHAPNNYTHKVRIDNILSYCDADAPDGNTFLFLDTACKRLNITRCGAETKNCIISNGKTVETFISGCILYATGSTGYAVKVYSDFTNGNGIVASNWMYAEGVKFVNCEIDNSNNKGVSFLISDSFVTLIENCYIGCSMKIAPPINTGTNTDIIIANNVFYGTTLSIGDSTFTRNNIYRCKVVNNNFDNSHIMTYEGSTIDISNNTFYTSNSYIYDTAISLGRNSDKLTVHDNSIYGAYKTGVICKDSPVEAAVYNINYNGIGDYGLYIEYESLNKIYRHNIRETAWGTPGYVNITPGTEIDISGTIASVTVSLAKGQKGYITGVLYTMAATSGAKFTVVISDETKMKIPSGTGWSTKYIYANDGAIGTRIYIPFKCVDDFSGTVSLINSITNSKGVIEGVKITPSYHSYFDVELL